MNSTLTFLTISGADQGKAAYRRSEEGHAQAADDHQEADNVRDAEATAVRLPGKEPRDQHTGEQDEVRALTPRATSAHVQ